MSGLVTLPKQAGKPGGRRQRNILTGGPDLDAKSLADFANLSGPLPQVIDTVNELRTGKVSPDDIEPVKIFERNGNVFTADHRRVVALRLAGLPIRYIKAPPREVRKALAKKNDLFDNGLSIKIRRGDER